MNESDVIKPVNQFLVHSGVQHPIIGGPMYPCSNPELVAAISNAGALGIVQPLSLTYVYGHDFVKGLELIRRLTAKPVGMNALIENSSKRYLSVMQQWVDLALEHDIRFFITSLGKPDWVVEAVHAAGGVVYHDATEAKWAKKGLDCGVDGLIAVNNRAGGHAGERDWQQLYDELKQFNVPVVCAGGIASRENYHQALNIGYSAVQMGTVFIATDECQVSDSYKRAIVTAEQEDVVLTQNMTGVSVSIIKPKNAKSVETHPLLAKLLKANWSKHWMRFLLSLRSLRRLKKMITDDNGDVEIWQAGKSVADIHEVRPVAQIIASFTDDRPLKSPAEVAKSAK